MDVHRLDDVAQTDHDRVGGKAASLGELRGVGLPVPDGFVVDTDAYREVVSAAGIDETITDALECAGPAAAASTARETLAAATVPKDVREAIEDAYDALDGKPFVAVRSSATAEDLPTASFAGQQETFLNVERERLVDRIVDCWASLFTERAIAYREEQGFDHTGLDIAVVVQRMVDADASGVLFTRNPATGDTETVIEAAWGLGEAVVDGAVSPDHYVIDATGAIDVTVADKDVRRDRNEAGETVERSVSPERRRERVLSDEAIRDLVSLGERVADHYGEPQDVEWAIVDDELYMLQSRPITTIDAGPAEQPADAGPRSGPRNGNRADSTDEPTPEGTPVPNGGVRDTSSTPADDATHKGGGGAGDSDDLSGSAGKELLSGLGGSPGTAAGPVRVVRRLDELDKVGEGDVLVTETTSPDMVSAMRRASGVVTDAGGMTSHAAIVSRELGVPAVLGTSDGTSELSDDALVTVDGDRGKVIAGDVRDADAPASPGADGSRGEYAEVRPTTPVKPMTATEVKVNVSLPEAAERAAATGADGVGLLRMEHMVLSLGSTPDRYVSKHGEEAYTDELAGGLRQVLDAFYPRPVRVRTLDAPTDEFRELDGGEEEPTEANPMLGYRGIRRSFDAQATFRLELAAFSQLYDAGYDNLEVMFPLVVDASDVERARDHLRDAGIDPAERRWGAMIETPAAALVADELVATGLDFVSFGTNDLTQYTLAVDRNNERVAPRYDETHTAVVRLLTDVIETCRDAGVDTGICGEAASRPELVDQLVTSGIGSLSVNIDAVRDVQHEVKRTEQRLVLDSVR